MSRGKAINVKIATTKVIKALENKLDQIKKDKANQKVNEEKFSKAQEKYNKEVAKIALAHISKADELSAHTRYNGEGETLRGYEIGHMCDEKGPGMKYTQHHDWQKGFAIAHVVNDYPHIQMIHVAPDYSCVVDGKVFTL